jgi:lipopolysaccharide transport system permease protein
MSSVSVAEVPQEERPVEVRPPTVRIRPARGWVRLNLAELWAYRELLFFLTWRDVKVRYHQTVLGIAWVVLQPLLTMVIFSLFFGRLAKVPSDDVPYTLFAFTALVPWTFFAFGLNQASNSLVGNAHLITKVYFPRLAIPIATVASGLVDLLIGLVVLVGMMVLYAVMGWYPITLTLRVVFVPAFLLLGLVIAMGVGLWLSALNVQYRDVRYVVPFLTQIWMFATPIAYPSSMLSEPWQTLFGLNPMTGVVEGMRWALLNTSTAPGPIVAVSSFAAVALLVSGLFVFRRMEKSFADVV